MIKIERLTPDAQATFERDGNTFTAQTGQLLSRQEFDTLVITAGEVMISINEEQIEYHTAQSIHPRPELLNAAEIAVDVIFTEELQDMNPPAAPQPATPVDEISTPTPEPVVEPVIVFPTKTA